MERQLSGRVDSSHGAFRKPMRSESCQRSKSGRGIRGFYRYCSQLLFSLLILPIVQLYFANSLYETHIQADKG